MQKFSFETVTEQINDRGWAKVEGVYDDTTIRAVTDEMDSAVADYEHVQADAGVLEESRHAYHHTVVRCTSQLRFIDPNPLHAFLEHYFGGRYILNTMGTSYVWPNSPIYTQKIHRDIRSFSGTARLLLNTLIMLDDSTEENGATWMLEHSQNRPDKPDDAYFYKNSVRALGKRGDVLLFDGNIWHAAGANRTNAVRRIITPIYTKPFIKQALDYPRAFGYDFQRRISPELRQILGYNALTPVTLQEFYQPREKRFYKPDQG